MVSFTSVNKNRFFVGPIFENENAAGCGSKTAVRYLHKRRCNIGEDAEQAGETGERNSGNEPPVCPDKKRQAAESNQQKFLPRSVCRNARRN